MLGWTLLKGVNAARFSGIATFLGSVSFHSEMFGATTFELVLGDCIVNAMIFINKYIKNPA